MEAYCKVILDMGVHLPHPHFYFFRRVQGYKVSCIHPCWVFYMFCHILCAQRGEFMTATPPSFVLQLLVWFVQQEGLVEGEAGGKVVAQFFSYIYIPVINVNL